MGAALFFQSECAAALAPLEANNCLGGLFVIDGAGGVNSPPLVLRRWRALFGSQRALGNVNTRRARRADRGRLPIIIFLTLASPPFLSCLASAWLAAVGRLAHVVLSRARGEFVLQIVGCASCCWPSPWPRPNLFIRSTFGPRAHSAPLRNLRPMQSDEVERKILLTPARSNRRVFSKRRRQFSCSPPAAFIRRPSKGGLRASQLPQFAGPPGSLTQPNRSRNRVANAGDGRRFVVARARLPT